MKIAKKDYEKDKGVCGKMNYVNEVRLNKVTYSDIDAHYAFMSLSAFSLAGSENVLEASSLPYRLPRVYSLDDEAFQIEQIGKRNKKLHKRFERSDLEALASYWNKVGEDINEGIRRATAQ